MRREPKSKRAASLALMSALASATRLRDDPDTLDSNDDDDEQQHEDGEQAAHADGGVEKLPTRLMKRAQLHMC